MAAGHAEMKEETMRERTHAVDDIESLGLTEEQKKKVILAQINSLRYSLPGEPVVAQIKAKTRLHAALFIGRIQSETFIKLSLGWTDDDKVYRICDVDSVTSDGETATKLRKALVGAQGHVSVHVEPRI